MKIRNRWLGRAASLWLEEDVFPILLPARVGLEYLDDGGMQVRRQVRHVAL